MSPSQPNTVEEFIFNHEDMIARFTQYHWKPKLDITVYELALCIPCFFGAAVEDLPIEAKRHFVEIKEDGQAANH